MYMPQISVIVPVYNAESTLLRCINSLLCQTFKNFELILVDDCSNDNSRLLMKKCSEEDDRIKCLYADRNGGGGEARNTGLNVATGDFVMFADSDDWVAPDWIECLYEAQKSHPSCLVMSNLYDCMKGKNVVRKSDYHEDHIIEIDYFELYSKFHLDGYLVNKIFERSVIELNTIRFNVLRKEGEDVDFIFRYIYSKKISKFCLIGKPLYYYWHDNENSVTNSYNPKTLEENLHCFECRLPYVPSEKISEFCDIYFSYLFPKFNAVFDKRSNMSFCEAIRYNNKILRSNPFRFCVENSNQGNSRILLMRIVRCYNYFLIWILQKVLSILR